ncbi:MAG: CocE/NonD family hydrolase, partial [Thermoleophilia bacterium]
MPPSPAQIAHRIARAARPLVTIDPPPAGVHADWDVPVPMPDGVTLRANVFRPPATEAGERVPVIMCAHPYGKDRIPAKRRGRGVDPQYRALPQPGPVRISAWTGWEGPDPAAWVPRGYAVVNLDLRGSGSSEGVGELLSRREAEDYAEAIAWAAAQPWSTGRVGLLGVSYLALAQYGVAALRPPALAAICPWEGFSDVYRDFARPGGIHETGFLRLWSTVTRRTSRLAEDLGAQVAARPTRDEWYRAHSPDLAAIEAPMLVCGSFSDHDLHTRGSFEAFRRAGSERRWLYTHRGGKWERFYSGEALATQARFLDWALKGEDNGWDTEPPVRLAIHEDGAAPAEVRHEAAWPPDDLTWEELPLDIASRSLRPAGDTPDRSSILLDTRG